MNEAYLKKSCEVIPKLNALVIVASRRARALAKGAKPLVSIEKDEGFLDIALHEISLKKVIIDNTE